MKPKAGTKSKPAASSSSGKRGSPRIPRDQLERLLEELREARETLEAIRNGEADAVVVNGAHGNQVYSLAGAEQPYRIYVEQMQEGAVTVSADKVILFCNRRLAEMLKTPMERVMGSSISGCLSDGAWQEISRVFTNEGGAIKHECMLRSGDGMELPVHLAASCQPKDGNNVMYLVVTDLTSQKEEGRLRQGKELAEKASATKDAFLAALSHELRTPLTPVLMLARELEKDPELPDKIRRAMGTIRRNVELEARLIDDLLDLTRVVRGKLELNFEPMDFHTALRQAVEICRPESDAKGQTVQLRLRARRTTVEADAVRIKQAIWNLIRNAVKFTPIGGWIVLKTTLNNQGDRIILEVEDKGIGFDASMSTRLFDAFEQGDRQITRQFGGLGLGLAITKSIMAAHNGKVYAHSEGTGKGATFIIELPLSPGAGMPTATFPRIPMTAPDPKGLRLLLVEDHLDTRRSMEFLLARYKHQVKSAASAREALTLAATYPFDLVISDLGLPDISGLELMKQLSERFGLKGIGVSGYGMEEDIAQSKAAGFKHHLTKPVSMDRLQAAIAEVIRGR